MPHPIRQALGVFAGLAVAAAACAQPFPSKPIRYIAPFPPGGPTDTFSRALTAQLGEALGQPVVVENVPGAAASIGMDRVAKSAPDGHTIGLATTGSHAINPHRYGPRLTSTPAEFQKVIESDYAKWGKIVRASGARVD
jgi:tripartite-type tricarboxylate transporter receptor subunit TctC